MAALPVPAAAQPGLRSVGKRHSSTRQELLGEICQISGARNVPFDVGLAGELIGSVDEGGSDHSLKDGLIGDWERVLDRPDR